MTVWGGIRLIGHRGGGRLAPENTLEGFEVAARFGYRAVEFDVMLTRDGTPVLMHDDTLERTTDGHGPLAETGDAELARLHANRGFEAEFPGARIPALAAAMALCERLQLLANIEIKPAAGHDDATGQAVAAAIARDWTLPVAPVVSSFSEAALAAARRENPHLSLALLVEQVPADWRQRLDRLGCRALHTDAQQTGWSWLEEAVHEGIPVRCYTVNDRVTAQRLFERGVQAIFTDALDLFPATDH